MKPLDLSLYLITDERIPWEICLRKVEESVAGGVTIVQLREKHSSSDALRHKISDLKCLLDPLGIPLVLNDRLDLAHELGVGVHLGKSDGSPKEARLKLGPDAIIGYSIESIEQFERSEFEYCSYISASPVFPTSTKADAAKPIDLIGLARLRAACPKPIVGIGGIDVSNARSIFQQGADGICVVSSILLSDSPREVSRRLRASKPIGNGA